MPLLPAFAFFMWALGQQPACARDQVVAVGGGRDYTVTLCGGSVVGLRGVEAPLHAVPGGGRDGGDILGDKDITPEALKFLTGLLVGKKVTIVDDGYRIGDFIGRQYSYVYLPDRTLVNAELIRRGYGYAERQGAHPMLARFIALEDAAHRAKVGVWNQ